MLSPGVTEEKDLTNSLDATDTFLNSEKAYVENGLRRGFDIFVDRLEVHVEQNDIIIKIEEINDIFGTYKVIYNANRDLLDQLMKARMNRETELRDSLGDIMTKFIPFLKLYIDYIVRKQECFGKLVKLKKSNKKFAKFLAINEACARRKIKSFLDEPVARLPKYLQQMAAIYIAWEREDLGAGSAGAKKALFNAISKVREVTEDIAKKVKNKKARRLLGTLQKNLFNNKILLLASHRFVVTHGELSLLVGTTLETCHFILCNDILLVAKKKKMLNVLPLIGLKVEKFPSMPDKVRSKNKNPNFGVKAIDPTGVKQFVIFADTEPEKDAWMGIIEDTVDEEEHSLHPCNPVDLEKRLRKEKTSPAGAAETLTVTDPALKQKIEDWKKNKNKKKKKSSVRKKDSAASAKAVAATSSTSTPPSGAAPTAAPSAVSATAAKPAGPGRKKPPPGRRPPPPRVRSPTATGGRPPPRKGFGKPPSPGQAMRHRKASSPPPVTNSNPSSRPNTRPHTPANASGAATPNLPPPVSPKGLTPSNTSPAAGSGAAVGSGLPPPVPRAESKDTSATSADSAAPAGPAGPPPPVPADAATPPPPVPTVAAAAAAAAAAGAVSAVPEDAATEPKANKPGRKSPFGGGGGRASMLAGIANFNKSGGLKKVDHSRPPSQSVISDDEEQDMGNLLMSTLASYRQYVMDEDDDVEDDDEDWA